MQQTEPIIAIYCIPNLSFEERLKLADLNLSLQKVLNLRQRDINDLLGIRRFPQDSTHDIEQNFNLFMHWLEQSDHRFVWYHSTLYPRLLKEIPDPPFLLTYQGDISEPEPVISVVGTRNPTECARLSAYALGLQCADSGTLVVSGLARGIDRSVQGGVVAGKGRTWAIMGGGLAVVCKKPTSFMHHIIASGGAIMSEFHPQASSLRWHFPIRNRVIAGLSPATVVVQAPIKSGALITADYALRQGRDVFVHDAGLQSSVGAGTRGLAEDGAPSIRSLTDIPHPPYASYRRARELSFIHSMKADTFPFRFGSYRFKFSEGLSL